MRRLVSSGERRVPVRREDPDEPKEASPSAHVGVRHDSTKTMNRRNPLAIIAGWFALMFGPAHMSVAADNTFGPAGPAATGSITGQVSNAATKSFLEGAVIVIAGTDRSITTDREGRFLVTAVQGDTVTLDVSFTGLDPQRITVPVAAGQRVVRDVELTSDIYKTGQVHGRRGARGHGAGGDPAAAGPEREECRVVGHVRERGRRQRRRFPATHRRHHGGIQQPGGAPGDHSRHRRGI